MQAGQRNIHYTDLTAPGSQERLSCAGLKPYDPAKQTDFGSVVLIQDSGSVMQIRFPASV
ncbi:hypothetical protein AOE01nite_03670 [Acetobacter oeni]|uniref:Uncharacterized protein n=1 Tax=Acetobacter oeni TaxID=304077 RepID=A0A511XGR9_9PROT|nr:hypothetical protein AOE01nite_03670 [Acetobacter oeni]